MAKTLEIPLDLDSAAALFKAKQLLQQLEDIGKAGHDAGTKGSDAFGNLGSTLERLATKFVGVNAAVDAITKAFQLYSEAQERIAQQRRQDATTMGQAMSMAGDLPQMNKVQQTLLGGGQFGVKPDQAAEVYKMVNRTWVGSTWEQRSPVIEGAMQSALAGKDVVKMAEVMAGLAEIGVPAGQLKGYASYLISASGGSFGKEDTDALKIWVQGGLGSVEEGLDAMVKLAKSGQSMRSFRSLAEKLTKRYTRAQLHNMGAEFRKVMALPSQERFAAVGASEQAQREAELTLPQRVMFGEKGGALAALKAGGADMQAEQAAFLGSQLTKDVAQNQVNQATARGSALKRPAPTWQEWKDAQQAYLDRTNAGAFERFGGWWSRGVGNLLDAVGLNAAEGMGSMDKFNAPITVNNNVGVQYNNAPTEKAKNDFTRTGEQN